MLASARRTRFSQRALSSKFKTKTKISSIFTFFYILHRKYAENENSTEDYSKSKQKQDNNHIEKDYRIYFYFETDEMSEDVFENKISCHLMKFF